MTESLIEKLEAGRRHMTRDGGQYGNGWNDALNWAGAVVQKHATRPVDEQTDSKSMMAELAAATIQTAPLCIDQAGDANKPMPDREMFEREVVLLKKAFCPRSASNWNAQTDGVYDDPWLRELWNFWNMRPSVQQSGGHGPKFHVTGYVEFGKDGATAHPLPSTESPDVVRLFAHRQMIDWQGEKKCHITFTPNRETNLTDAECLGSIALQQCEMPVSNQTPSGYQQPDDWPENIAAIAERLCDLYHGFPGYWKGTIGMALSGPQLRAKWEPFAESLRPYLRSNKRESGSFTDEDDAAATEIIAEAIAGELTFTKDQDEIWERAGNAWDRLLKFFEIRKSSRGKGS